MKVESVLIFFIALHMIGCRYNQQRKYFYQRNSGRNILLF
jgi:hypothetical protein